MLTQWYDAALNTARILDLEEGRDLFGELQPFTDCVCQIGHTAITPDGRLALAGIFEWTDDYSTAITDRGRVVAWDTDTGELTRTIDLPWEPDGLAVTPRWRTPARQRHRGLGPLRPRLGSRSSGATRPTCRAAGSAACRWRVRHPTAPVWSSSGARR